MPTVTVRTGEGRYRLLTLADIPQIVEDRYLRRAMEVALCGVRTSAPNPMVGCVIVRESDGTIVGEGFHRAAGEPHAEVNALADAGDAARGATAYVTLEPCSHHGRTPPCTDALLAAGVTRVVIGSCDPNPEAAGGAAVLREAGVIAEFTADPEAFVEMNRGWLNRVATGRPLVTAKVGVSLDGRIALKRGVRTAITGPAGRTITNLLRSQTNAVLVSEMTLRTDSPRLTLTGDDGSLLPDQPTRVVLCRTAAPDPNSPSFTEPGGLWLWLCPEDLEVPAVPDTVTIVRYPGELGLDGALQALGSRGINRLLVEPGKRLLAALVREELIDELVMVQAGGFLGSDALGLAPEQYGDDGVVNGELVRSFQPIDTKIAGDVVATLWRPKGPSALSLVEGDGQCSLDS